MEKLDHTNVEPLTKDASLEAPELVISDERLEVFHGDSRALGLVLQKSSVALVVTSPPYPGVLQPSPDYVTFATVEDFNAAHEILQAVWSACFDVLEDLGRLVVNITDQAWSPPGQKQEDAIGQFPNVAGVVKRCHEIGFLLRETFIWHKGVCYKPANGSWPYPKGVLTGRSFETCLVFQKPLQFGQRRNKLADVSDEVKARSKLGPTESKWLEDTVWYIPPSNDPDHPYTFPKELPRRFVRLFSYADDTVLDPFAGAGTTLRAALDEGRKAIGCELSPKFVEVMKQRFAQGGLF